MRSFFGNPKAMGPIDLRLLPGKFHSVAKQASFLFGILRFSMGFGKFWETKMEAKIDLCDVFYDVFFRA